MYKKCDIFTCKISFCDTAFYPICFVDLVRFSQKIRISGEIFIQFTYID